MTHPKPSEIEAKCPFCNEGGFDLIGLKLHILNWCEVFTKTDTSTQDLMSKWLSGHEAIRRDGKE